MIERVIKNQKLATYKKRNSAIKGIVGDMDLDGNKVQPTEYFTTEYMLQWLQ